MPRRRGRSTMDASGDLWTVLSLAYNYVDYEDVLRGLQMCKRASKDLPKAITRIRAGNMTQCGLEIMAKRFTVLEQLVIVQYPLKPRYRENEDGCFDDDNEEVDKEEEDKGVEEGMQCGGLHDVRGACAERKLHMLDFSKVYFPQLRKLAVCRLPMASLAFNTRNTPALTHLYVCANKYMPYKSSCVELASPLLRQLWFEGIRLTSTQGLAESLSNCCQLEQITMRWMPDVGSLTRIMDLTLPSCQRLEVTGCCINGLRLWAPELRRLAVTHGATASFLDIKPREGPPIAVYIKGTTCTSHTIAQLQEHPRVGRARVAGLSASILPLWAKQPSGKGLSQHVLSKEHPCGAPWIPEEWAWSLGSFEEEEDEEEPEGGHAKGGGRFSCALLEVEEEEDGEGYDSEEEEGLDDGDGSHGSISGYDYGGDDDDVEEDEDPVRRKLLPDFMSAGTPKSEPPKQPAASAAQPAASASAPGMDRVGAQGGHSLQPAAAGGSAPVAPGEHQSGPAQQQLQQAGPGVSGAGMGGGVDAGVDAVGAAMAGALDIATRLLPMPRASGEAPLPAHPLQALTALIMQLDSEPSDAAMMSAVSSVVQLGAMTAMCGCMLMQMIMLRRWQEYRRTGAEGRLDPTERSLPQVNMAQTVAELKGLMGQVRNLTALGGQESEQLQQLLQELEQLQRQQLQQLQSQQQRRR